MSANEPFSGSGGSEGSDAVPDDDDDRVSREDLDFGGEHEDSAGGGDDYEPGERAESSFDDDDDEQFSDGFPYEEGERPTPPPEGTLDGDQDDSADLPDPARERSRGGENVTGTEARELIEQAREQGTQIENLDERHALASQLERITGVDARQLADRGGVEREVSFDPQRGRFVAEAERSRRERARTQLQERLEEETDQDLQPGEDFLVRQRGNRFRAIPTGRRRRRRRSGPVVDEPVVRRGDEVGERAPVDFGPGRMSDVQDARRTIAVTEQGVATVDAPLGASSTTPASAIRSIPVAQGIEDIEEPDTTVAGDEPRPPARGAVTAPTDPSAPRPDTGGDQSVVDQALATPTRFPIAVSRAISGRGVGDAISGLRGGRERRERVVGEARDVTGAPTEEELVTAAREETGAPAQEDLVESANVDIEGETGVNPQQAVEQERQAARTATLSTLASGARYAQENPAQAIAVGGPVALAEPTPVGEAGLLAGIVGGAIGYDVASRIEPDDARERDPSAFGSELETPDRAPRDEPSELDAPERRPESFEPELAEPEDRPEQQTELDAPEQRPESFDSELGTPDERPGETGGDLTVLRTAELIGRQRGRQRQRERDPSSAGIPERFIPDEEVVIGGEGGEVVEEQTEPELPRDEWVYDRPDGGVRTFRQDATEPQVEDAQEPLERQQQAEAVLPGRGAGVDVLPGVRERERAAQEPGVQVDQVGLVDQAQIPLQIARLDTRVGARTEQLLRAETRLGTEQRLQQRFRTPERTRTPPEYVYPPELVEPPRPPGTPNPPNFPRGPRQPLGDRNAGVVESDDVVPSFGGGGRETDLAPGWFGETVTTIALGGAGGAPRATEADLEARPFAERATGSLPTGAMLFGDEETQERIAGVEAFLSFGGGQS